jgi:hypothetical protein
LTYSVVSSPKVFDAVVEPYNRTLPSTSMSTA